MLWQYLAAFSQKKWNAAQAVALPKTITPLAGLSERSALEIGPVPLILAQAAGSLLKTITGQHSVSAVGQMNHTGMTFYRVYLSNDPGTFIHLAVAQNDPKSILESRIYQPYKQLIVPYSTMAQAAAAGGSPDQSWEMWLLDNDDPSIGGMIGCPVMLGDAADDPRANEPGIDPSTLGIPYARTWSANNGLRIPPLSVNEYMLRADGDKTVMQHQMMHYGRALDTETDEFLLVSAVTNDTGSSLNTWLGMDIKIDDLIVYPSAE
jgi:hypothetical protein